MAAVGNRVVILPRGKWWLELRAALARGAVTGSVAAAYFSAASIALLLAIPPGYATPVWPPAGIALAAWLAFGPRIWPGIWLGATLANFSITGTPALAAIAIGAGNTAEAALAAWMLARFMPLGLKFNSPARVWQFGATALAASSVAATCGVGTLLLSGAVPWEYAGEHWLTWWLGDATGIIIVTPLLVSWFLDGSDRLPRKRPAESGLFFALLLLAAAFLQIEDRAVRDVAQTLAYLMIPLLTWAATRFDQRAVTAASFAIAMTAVVDLLDGGGALFSPLALNAALLLTQLVVSAIALMGLVLSAVSTGLVTTQAQLEVALRDLERRIQAMHESRAAEAPPLASAAAATSTPVERLTNRERQVLRLVADGCSNAEAARRLHLSPRSVETYRARLMQKIGAENFAALMKYAIRHGYATPD